MTWFQRLMLLFQIAICLTVAKDQAITRKTPIAAVICFTNAPPCFRESVFVQTHAAARPARKNGPRLGRYVNRSAMGK